MSDIDDDVKEAKATRFQTILDKLELLDKEIDNLTEKPKQTNKPIAKDSDSYKNKRNVYVNKLNNLEIQNPKPETLEYYDVKFDEGKRLYV